MVIPHFLLEFLFDKFFRLSFFFFNASFNFVSSERHFGLDSALHKVMLRGEFLFDLVQYLLFLCYKVKKHLFEHNLPFLSHCFTKFNKLLRMMIIEIIFCHFNTFHTFVIKIHFFNKIKSLFFY